MPGCPTSGHLALRPTILSTNYVRQHLYAYIYTNRVLHIYIQILKQKFFLPKLLASQYQVMYRRNIKEEEVSMDEGRGSRNYLMMILWTATPFVYF